MSCCTDCGAARSADQRFCTTCGAAQSSESPQEATAEQEQHLTTLRKRTSPVKARSKSNFDDAPIRMPGVSSASLLIAALLLPVLVLGGAFLARDQSFRGSDPASDVATQQPSVTTPMTTPSAEPTTDAPDDDESLDTATASPPSSDVADDPLQLGYELQNQQCRGQYIVVLSSSGSPEAYKSTLTRTLSRVPGSSYLRTDESCSTFVQELDGTPIYAAYAGPFESMSEACSTREVSTVPNSYVRMLSTSTTGREVCACLRQPEALPRLSESNAYNPNYGKKLLVSDIQTMLYKAGYNPNAAITGFFQDLTDRMVRRFQSDNFLAVDGWVGPQTWGALQQAACSNV